MCARVTAVPCFLPAAAAQAAHTRLAQPSDVRACVGRLRPLLPAPSVQPSRLRVRVVVRSLTRVSLRGRAGGCVCFGEWVIVVFSEGWVGGGFCVWGGGMWLVVG